MYALLITGDVLQSILLLAFLLVTALKTAGKTRIIGGIITAILVFTLALLVTATVLLK